jgi:hypothetical protein
VGAGGVWRQSSGGLLLQDVSDLFFTCHLGAVKESLHGGFAKAMKQPSRNVAKLIVDIAAPKSTLNEEDLLDKVEVAWGWRHPGIPE